MSGVAPAGGTAAPSAPDPKKKTAFGLPALELPPGLRPGATSEAQAQPPAQQAPQQPPAPQAPQQAPPQPPAQQAAPARKKRGMAQTMLGMPATTVGSAGAPAPAPVSSTQQPAQPAAPAGGTGGGFAPVGVDATAATQAMPATPMPSPATVPGGGAPEAPAGEPSPAARKVAAQSNRTMLGMMAVSPGAEPAAPQAPEAQAPQAPEAQAPQGGSAAAKVAAQSNRTMLGMMAAPGAGAPAQQPAPVQQPAPQQPGYGGAPGFTGGATSGPGSDEEQLPLRTRRWKLWLLIGVCLLGLVGLGLGLLALTDGAPEVRAAVARGAEGEVLQVDVPEAPAGTKVRFDGEELPTTAGRVVFPLGANDLQLGDNQLTVEIVSPDGDVDEIPLVLTVRYRVRPDLDGLGDPEPKLRIVVDALPGSVVTIDEAPVPLDVTGHGVLEVPVAGEVDQEPVLERTFDYRVVPPGAPPAQGQVRIRVPFAALRVERPSGESITDKARIEIAGSAHSDATVTIDGRPVEVREGRFLHEIEVPMGVSEHVVVATREDRAPRRVNLQVRRVEDLAAEAASYAVDEELDYARLATGPADYRGRKVEFVGRIYNVDVHDGHVSLQMVVRDCARGQRCPLWVNHDGGTPVRINQWVRVLGEVVGEQQYRATSGEVRSDPAVKAAFVLPMEGGR